LFLRCFFLLLAAAAAAAVSYAPSSLRNWLVLLAFSFSLSSSSGTELLQYSRYPKHTGWLERLFAFLGSAARLFGNDVQHLI
jgi:hypothetical protein